MLLASATGGKQSGAQANISVLFTSDRKDLQATSHFLPLVICRVDFYFHETPKLHDGRSVFRKRKTSAQAAARCSPRSGGGGGFWEAACEIVAATLVSASL